MVNYGETLSDRPGTHFLTVINLIPSAKKKGSFEGSWRFRFEVPEQ
ncbi:MAG: hypothetical protein M3338_02665 [Actinomycetota bacterium]|nr:hypothetical protein [Actinomycetota bacterium]